MALINPKTHDSLFKWLIAAFTEDFFAHYFPQVKIGRYEFIDKEFLSRYEALKESLKSDLFLVMEVEVDDEWRQVMIIIEHKSERKDIGKRVMEYFCYGWLLKFMPVWSIGVFTDDAVWRKRIPDKHWYAFHSQRGRLHHYYDVIKIKDEKSSDLITKRSLMCKLLALKANDKGTDPEQLVREIYKTAAELKTELDDDKRLLLEQWVDVYKKISDEVHDEIKKEVDMDHPATTISEHIRLEGEKIGEEKGFIKGEKVGEEKGFIKGEKIGEEKGFIKGEIKGEIKILEVLYDEGLLSHAEFKTRVTPLREKLAELTETRSTP